MLITSWLASCSNPDPSAPHHRLRKPNPRCPRLRNTPCPAGDACTACCPTPSVVSARPGIAYLRFYKALAIRVNAATDQHPGNSLVAASHGEGASPSALELLFPWGDTRLNRQITPLGIEAVDASPPTLLFPWPLRRPCKLSRGVHFAPKQPPVVNTGPLKLLFPWGDRRP